MLHAKTIQDDGYDLENELEIFDHVPEVLKIKKSKRKEPQVIYTLNDIKDLLDKDVTYY